MHRFQRALLFFLAACSSSEATTNTNEAQVAGWFDAIDWSIDAPWRVEPPYGSIPITVTVNDANQSGGELGTFCGLRIIEIGDAVDDSIITVAPPSAFHEIEIGARWPASSDTQKWRHVTRLWSGDDPALDPPGDAPRAIDVSASDEWNATFFYTPQHGGTAGDVVRLWAFAYFTPEDGTCDITTTMAGTVPLAGVNLPPTMFNNPLKIKIGSPLPRFGANWVYGDLHYHSQGTDNEGESGTSYRAALQTMKTLGLDFAFASDHASDSDQLTGLGSMYATNIDAADGWFYDNIIIPLVELVVDLPETIELPKPEIAARRDMSQYKFVDHHAQLNDGPASVNAEILSSPGTRTPQIFLGGEVDAIPEVDSATNSYGAIPYGNARAYPWRGDAACKIHVEIPTTDGEFDLEPCDATMTDEAAALPGVTGKRFLVRDVQGPLMTSFYGRQHFLHLPDADIDGAHQFVSSCTSLFGGATRRLGDFLGHDYNATGGIPECGPESTKSKGWFFLAHPNSNAGGSGVGRLGPDIVPYSETQLADVFNSPAFLGLQLWNEAHRMHSEPATYIHEMCVDHDYDPATPCKTIPEHYRFDQCSGFPMVPWDQNLVFDNTLEGRIWGWGCTDDEKDVSSSMIDDFASLYSGLHHGAATWDRLLLWSLDPGKKPAWITGDEPRRVFMAGGSDAHGDLNYRREGYMVGWVASQTTAIGTPRNLVQVATPPSQTITNPFTGATQQAYGQKQITDALRAGNFSVTDGPALRIAIDKNGNGVIDGPDIPMGGYDPAAGSNVRVVVEWQSNVEMGPVTSVDLYVGAFNSMNRPGKVYAPTDHGVRGPRDPNGSTVKPYKDAATGTIYPGFEDGYMKNDSLRFDVVDNPATPIDERFDGRRVFTLSKSTFKVLDAHCSSDVEVIKEFECDDVTGECHKPVVVTHTDCVAENIYDPQRIFVRAFAKTSSALHKQATGPLPAVVPIERLAYSNPVWAKL